MSLPSDVAAVAIAPHVRCGGDAPLLFIAGTCVIESRDSALEHAEVLAEIAARRGLPLVFKASYDKANRTSIDSFRGPGLDAGLAILAEVRERTGLAVTSDVHEPAQCREAGSVLDIIQIPAFLCRQTDLLLAAAATGKVVNVKKGQFLAPWDVGPLVEKLRAGGAAGVMLTERGSSFGYNNLVADMRSVAVMRQLGVPVVFDATHSVQRPGGLGKASGGEPEFIPTLARAAVAAGADAVFLEVHREPAEALSDGPNALRLDLVEALLVELGAIHRVVREHRAQSVDR
ncbi:MAG: 3-deoxy-8-phosphooctulonate synthase [Acidobacteriota bacterium]|nr:MAG: 3-deoxy-8-phosphooctulonate synthase [Acidobacteriota bacterium]